MLIELYATMAQVEIEKKNNSMKEYKLKRTEGNGVIMVEPKALDFDLFSKEYQSVVDGVIKPFELMKKLGLTKPTFCRYRRNTIITEDK